MVDMVNRPSHYTQGKIEVIEFIEDQNFDYHLGNAVKYIARCRHKGTPIVDVDKAIWYLNRWKEKQLGVYGNYGRGSEADATGGSPESRTPVSEVSPQYAASKGDRVN